MAADTLITLAEPVELQVPPSGPAVLWSAFSENRGAVIGAVDFHRNASRPPQQVDLGVQQRRVVDEEIEAE